MQNDTRITTDDDDSNEQKRKQFSPVDPIGTARNFCLAPHMHRFDHLGPRMNRFCAMHPMHPAFFDVTRCNGKTLCIRGSDLVKPMHPCYQMKVHEFSFQKSIGFGIKFRILMKWRLSEIYASDA